MLIGNLGADPEMRYTSTGSALTTFRMAVNRYYKATDGTNREETEWCTIVTWGQLAETLGANLTKGRRVYVEGRLATRSWDGQDGQKRYRTEIVANQVIFLDRPDSSGSGMGELFVDNLRVSTTFVEAVPGIAPPPPLSLTARWLDATLQLTLTGEAARSYAIEWSDDLSTWALLDTRTSVNGNIVLTDGAAADSATRFYRARLVE
jgi:single-strand DNA-binding protein